jgi:hypothetical protein
MKSRKDFELDQEYKEYLKIQFAMAAMHGLLSDVGTQREIKDKDGRFKGYNFSTVVALNAIEFADELLKQLES